MENSSTNPTMPSNLCQDCLTLVNILILSGIYLNNIWSSLTGLNNYDITSGMLVKTLQYIITFYSTDNGMWYQPSQLTCARVPYRTPSRTHTHIYFISHLLLIIVTFSGCLLTCEMLLQPLHGYLQMFFRLFIIICIELFHQ